MLAFVVVEYVRCRCVRHAKNIHQRLSIVNAGRDILERRVCARVTRRRLIACVDTSKRFKRVRRRLMRCNRALQVSRVTRRDTSFSTLSAREGGVLGQSPISLVHSVSRHEELIIEPTDPRARVTLLKSAENLKVFFVWVQDDDGASILVELDEVWPHAIELISDCYDSLMLEKAHARVVDLANHVSSHSG